MCWPHELAGKFEAGTNAMPPPHRGGFLLIEQSRVLSYAPRRHCQRADVWPATSKLSSFRIVGNPYLIGKVRFARHSPTILASGRRSASPESPNSFPAA